MTVRVVAQVTIDADQAEVFKYLTHLKYHFLWNPHLRSMSSTEVLKLGTTYTSSSLLLGVRVQGQNVVTKLTANKELELQNKVGLISYTVNHQLSPKRKGTLVVCSTDVTVNSEIFKYAASVPKMLARRELQTDLQALKIAVEQQLH